MSRTAPAPPEIRDWQAQYLRVVAFPCEPQPAVPQMWWRNLVGAEPESSNQRARIDRHESGALDGMTLSLDIDVERIQWTVAPRIALENLPDRLPTIGTFVERVGWFRDLIQRWLPHCPSVSRLAFTSVLLFPVNSSEEACDRLNRYLRSVDVNERCSDFQFRVNRRIASQTPVPDLTINRLCTWAALAYAVELRARVLQHNEFNDRRINQLQGHMCSLELDINTAVPRDELPQEHLPAIFAELIELGMRVAERGDDELCQ